MDVLNRINILVVEDTPVTREMITYLMKNSLNYGENTEIFVAEASTGSEALHKIRSIKFDLVVTDISMPAKDGIGLVKDILDLNLLKKHQIMVLSGSILKEDVILLKYYGVTNIVAKPFDLSSFLKNVTNMLELKKTISKTAA